MPQLFERRRDVRRGHVPFILRRSQASLGYKSLSYNVLPVKLRGAAAEFSDWFAR